MQIVLAHSNCKFFFRLIYETYRNCHIFIWSCSQCTMIHFTPWPDTAYLLFCFLGYSQLWWWKQTSCSIISCISFTQFLREDVMCKVAHLTPPSSVMREPGRLLVCQDSRNTRTFPSSPGESRKAMALSHSGIIWLAPSVRLRAWSYCITGRVLWMFHMHVSLHMPFLGTQHHTVIWHSSVWTTSRSYCSVFL